MNGETEVVDSDEDEQNEHQKRTADGAEVRSLSGGRCHGPVCPDTEDEPEEHEYPVEKGV